MPVCKNCGARIEKFNTDLCPICGCKKPLEGVTSDTVEITTNIADLVMDGKKPKIASRKAFLVLTYLLSFLGINFLYIKWVKLFIIFLLSNIAIIGGLFALFYLGLGLAIYLSIIIPFAIAYAFDILASNILFFKVLNHKDGQGSFVK